MHGIIHIAVTEVVEERIKRISDCRRLELDMSCRDIYFALSENSTYSNIVVRIMKLCSVLKEENILKIF